MNQIEIKLCSGTLCYIMGGADLFEVESKLEDITDKDVRVSASVCLGHCQGENIKKPPCVEVNGDVHSGVSLERLIEIIMSI